MCSERLLRIVVVLAVVAMLFAAARAEASVVSPVAGGLQVALDPDVGFSDNGTTITWADQSGSGNNATGPLSGGVTRTLNALNGRAVIDFTGTDNNNYLNLGTAVSVANPTSSIFVIYNTTASKNHTLLSVTGMGFYINKGGSPLYPYVFYSVPNGGGFGPAFETTSYRIASNVVNSTNSLGLYFNGAQQTYDFHPSWPLTSSMKFSYLGARPDLPADTYQLTGNIAGLLYYDHAVNKAERTLIDNFLGSKLEIALTASDKYAGDTAANGNYDFNLVGIGYEGAADKLVASPGSGKSNGLILAENTPLATAGQYLLAGDKDLANSWVTTDLSGGITARWDRTWFVDNTDLPDAKMTFDFGDAGLTYDAGESYVLLYKAVQGGNFAPLNLSGVFSGGDQITFAVVGAYLQDGYYTLGSGVVPEPSTLALLACGLLGLLAYAWRKRK